MIKMIIYSWNILSISVSLCVYYITYIYIYVYMEHSSGRPKTEDPWWKKAHETLCGSPGDERVQKAQPHVKGPHIPQTINLSYRFSSRRQDEQAKISQCRRQDEQVEEIQEPKWWKSTWKWQMQELRIRVTIWASNKLPNKCLSGYFTVELNPKT